MFQYNLLLLYRNILRSKSSFFINLTGLSGGLACVLLIYLWVNDEWRFDRFHANDARLFQVMERSTENGQVIVHEATQGPLSEAMAKDLPEVEEAVGVMSLARENIALSLRHGGKSVRSTGIFAGSNFFRVFTFPLVAGEPAQVLTDRNAIVISKKLAESLFGTPGEAVGKALGDPHLSLVFCTQDLAHPLTKGV